MRDEGKLSKKFAKSAIRYTVKNKKGTNILQSAGINMQWNIQKWQN